MTIGTGFGQVTFVFSAVGPYGAVCTLGFENADDLSIEDASALIAGAIVSDGIMDNSPSTEELTSIHVKFGPDATGPSQDTVVAQGGGDTSSAAPSNLCFLIQKRTSGGGRSGRGRMFWPRPTEPAVDGFGNVDPDTQDALTTNFESFRNTLVTGGLNPVVLHSNADIPDLITSFSCAGVAATQRRRMRR